MNKYYYGDYDELVESLKTRKTIKENQEIMENNKHILQIISDKGWHDTSMIACFIPDGYNFCNNLPYSFHKPTEEQYTALSWVLNVAVEILKNANYAEQIFKVGIVTKQPILLDKQNYVNNQCAFKYIKNDFKHYVALDIPYYFIDKLSHSTVYVDDTFINLFMHKFNKIGNNEIRITDCFSKLQSYNTYDNRIHINPVNDIINKINESNLSQEDLMMIAQYCEIEAQQKNLLEKINK